jgi:Holliday junction resolvasome RuvABC endonuclease subunit
MSNEKYLYGLDIAWSMGITIYDLEEKEFVYVGTIDVNGIKLKAKEKREGMLEHGIRLRQVSTEFKKLMEKYPPKIIAIERYFAGHANATIALAKVHGVINELTYDKVIYYYPPKTVKEAIYKGNASKQQVQHIIKNNFVDVEFANEDESDSFAVALTYLIKNNLIDFVKPIV